MTARQPLRFAVLVAALVTACGSSAPVTWTFGSSIGSAAPSAGAAASAAPSAGPSAAPSGEVTASGSPAPSASASAGPVPSGSSNTAYTVVGTKPCPESRFECVTLSVPKDHFAAPGGDTWDVTFAIQRAAKEKQGTFVVITGGPGYSGIASADDYTDYYAQAITDAYDIVFMDQRGTGQSGPIQCVKAAAAFYQSDARPYVPAERDQAATDAETFARDCIAEAGVTEADLPLFGTKQAIEDLEAVRDYLAADKLQLYGESYGTQYVQTYAAAHPDRVETLYLDGPVDLTLDGPTYYKEAARSATDTLVATLDACTADASCKEDVHGGDALAVYDALAARLKTGPITFDYPLANGTTEQRELTASALEYGTFYYTYSRAARALLQRAIASASQDNFVPLAKLYYDSLSVDPDTLTPVEDPTWSDAAYYAIECQDYAFYPTSGDADARVDAWVAGAEAAGVNDLRLATSYYGDMPCLYWPGTPATDDRPAPLEDTAYPVVVLTSTTDPATPIANGMRIFSRLADAYFFQALGGPHVIYAWGEACPDDQMTAMIADGTRPSARVTTCPGEVADGYVPNAALAKADYKNALDLMQSMDDQILNSDDYAYRLDTDPISAGCDYGGGIAFTPTDTGTAMTLTACEFTSGVPMTGTGETDDEAGTFRLDVTIGSDQLGYERDAEGATRVRGTYDGKKVDQKGSV
jgi:pimeloyl-ACP methyl ester carboxylesterase